MKNLKIKKIMSIAFFEYLRIHIKQNWWCHLMLRRMLSAIVFSCTDLCPILCITCLETVFCSFSFAHLHFLFEWLLII